MLSVAWTSSFHLSSFHLRKFKLNNRISMSKEGRLNEQKFSRNIGRQNPAKFWNPRLFQDHYFQEERF